MAIAIQASHTGVVSNTEALWTLILSQKKSVQKALASRLTALLVDEKTEAQKAMVKESLTQAFKEMKNGEARPIEELFAEL